MLKIYFVLILTYQVTSEVYNGPASMDYFYNQSTANLHLLPQLSCPSGAGLDFNPSDGITNNYFKQTSDSNPVQYYKLSITSEMRSIYQGAFYLSTSCELDTCNGLIGGNYTMKSCADEFIPQLYNASTNFTPSNVEVPATFCDGNTSLDTVLYVLQEKKGQLNLIEYSDDNDTFYNSEKSYIDLSDYPEGEYIVGVGGYRKEYGSYYVQLQCVQYSYPLSSAQYQSVPSNISTINCEDNTFYGEINSSQPIAYHLLNITDDSILPVTLDTSNWYTVMYIINASENKAGYHEQIDFDDYGYLELSADDYTKGEYWIILQGWLNFDSNYTLIMTCAPGPGPSLSRGLMMAIVFGVAGCCLFCAFIYYISEWVKYNKYQKPQINLQRDQIREAEISLEFTTNKAFSGDDGKSKPRELSEETKEEPTLHSKTSMAGKSVCNGVVVRRLDSAKPVVDQMEEDQDVIQMVLAHAISCCEDGEGFDVFQVLAIRSFEEHSRDIRSFKPFEGFGIHFEVIRLSIFTETVFIGIVIAATQTWGIAVVVHKLVSSYFLDGSDGFECDMTISHWESVFSLKILAFLLSLVVTFSISVLLNGIRHNGLYEIMHRLELQHIKRVNHIALWFLQIGQAINYFVCLVAILGSYFIIFNANQEDDDDFAKAGLDMILNAVALFFMLELDDLMVTEQDYEDCGEHLKWILSNYTPNLEMNVLYGAKSEERTEDRVKSRKLTSGATMNKCNRCIVPIMYYMINLFSLIVTLICYGGGFIAPFVIFFCW